MTKDNGFVSADARGRVTLGSAIERDRQYQVRVDDAGTITLTPVAHVMSVEDYARFLADPVAYAERHNKTS